MALRTNGGTDPLWQAQDMDSENFRGARLIPRTENRNRTTDYESSLAPFATWRFKFFLELVAEWFGNSIFP